MPVKRLVSRNVCALIMWLPWLALMGQNVPDDVQRKIAALEQQAQKYLQEQKPQLAIPVLRDIV